MTKPREIAERLYASLHGHMVTPTLEGRDLNRITATLESYGSACRNAAYENAVKWVVYSRTVEMAVAFYFFYKLVKP